jgi:hypothetical protein
VPRSLMAVLPVPSEQMMMFLGIRERCITRGGVLGGRIRELLT